VKEGLILAYDDACHLKRFLTCKPERRDHAKTAEILSNTQMIGISSQLISHYALKNIASLCEKLVFFIVAANT
jgi:hypothetical protein